MAGRKTALLAIALLALGGAHIGAQEVVSEPEEYKARAIANEIITLRSRLAASLIKPGEEATLETFQSVCGAVGKRAREIAAEEGVSIRHATLRQRNPSNAATGEEARLIGRFEKDGGLKEIWDESALDGRAYARYTRPIYVEEACLACHGEAGARPAFIVEKYPDDRAYGYKAGELRGIISIMMPNGIKGAR